MRNHNDDKRAADDRQHNDEITADTRLPDELRKDIPAVNVSPVLNQEQKRIIVDLIKEYRDIFYMAGNTIGCLKNFEATLNREPAADQKELLRAICEAP